MTTQHHLLQILIFASISIQVHSVDHCSNGRTCPDSYTCSSDNDGVFCEKDGKIGMRSSWSLGSIDKEIFNCDVYLDMMTTTKCYDQKILNDIHKFCNDFYLNEYSKSKKDFLNSLHCAELGLRTDLSQYILAEKPSCSLLTQNLIKIFIKNHVNCEICFIPSTWTKIFQLTNKWKSFNSGIVFDFAKKCNKDFLEKQNIWKLEEIQRLAQNFIDQSFKLTGQNTTRIFKDLMALKDNADKPEETNLPITRTVMFVNEDDHAIWFEFYRVNDRRGRKLVMPGRSTQIDFDPNVYTDWWINAWFNGLESNPFSFKLWDGHGRSVRYTVRKDPAVYKAWIDGTEEHMFQQLGLVAG